jgi:hypothetical protein
MVYGPTGSGKSHTMFGCPKQPGIVYRALRDILQLQRGAGGEAREGAVEGDAGFGVGLFVQVAVLEIYNEEVYDLLVGSGANAKGNAPKVTTLLCCSSSCKFSACFATTVGSNHHNLCYLFYITFNCLRNSWQVLVTLIRNKEYIA